MTTPSPTQYLGFTKSVAATTNEDAAQIKGVTDKGLRNLCAPSADPADFESKLEVLSLTNLAGVTDSMLPIVAASLTRLELVLELRYSGSQISSARLAAECLVQKENLFFLVWIRAMTGTISGCLCWTSPGRG